MNPVHQAIRDVRETAHPDAIISVSVVDYPGHILAEQSYTITVQLTESFTAPTLEEAVARAKSNLADPTTEDETVGEVAPINRIALLYAPDSLPTLRHPFCRDEDCQTCLADHNALGIYLSEQIGQPDWCALGEYRGFLNEILPNPETAAGWAHPDSFKPVHIEAFIASKKAENVDTLEAICEGVGQVLTNPGEAAPKGVL